MLCTCILSFVGEFWSGYFCIVFFFFKQKTAYEMRISDWSSDVCSSDLSHRCSRRSLSDFWASPWARRLGSAALLERLRGEGLAIAGPAETLPRSRSSRLSACCYPQ